MTLTESIVKDTALKWIGELVPQAWEIALSPHFATGEPTVERKSV